MLFNLTFEGNLADEPELRVTPSGKAVCKLRVGHNTRRRSNGGEWSNGPTMWVTVTCWESLAERCAEHLRKGDTVIVEARDDLSVWAYQSPNSEKPAGQLQVTAGNVAVSMRFAGAQSARTAKTEQAEDPWSADDRELEPAF
ncbi:single-stranded DNA-binding protein [Micromonospora sp. NBC_00330]|uniref:single-stranded DNA-binding protein n=1 Tax=Micromonospora sp. NBC_00330 TaxID=2903585 RepID=UPI002E28A691|nr:single-stranded DNA-binding protein [Micromonospora sp. NBC_00330]